MKINLKSKCKCGSVNRFVARKPDFFTPTTGMFFCDACGSKLLYKVVKPKGAKNKKEVLVSTTIVWMSEALIELIKEEV